LAAAARASDVRVDAASVGDQTLVFSAGPGETNHVNIELQGSNYTIQDGGGAPMTAARPCAPWDLSPGSGTGAICPARDVTRINVDLGDQSDYVFVGGISDVLVPVFIRGGSGNDSLNGGEGPDTIDADDNSPDVIDCRGGQDTVYADPIDSISNCEVVIYGPPPSITPPPPRTIPPPRFVASVAAPSAAPIPEAAWGIPIRVRCSEACTATARLVIGARTARRLGWVHATHDVVVGRTTVQATSGRKLRLILRLTPACRRAFRTVRKVLSTLDVRADGADASTELQTKIVLTNSTNALR
jgi:Ca2+-binding RTX toxin-like protein